MDDLERRQRNELTVIGILCIAAVLAPFLAFVPCLRPADETIRSWFCRSGAITTVCSLLAQVRAANVQDAIRGGTFGESWKYWKLLIGSQRWWANAATSIAIAGALIWGYGDVALKHLRP